MHYVIPKTQNIGLYSSSDFSLNVENMSLNEQVLVGIKLGLNTIKDRLPVLTRYDKDFETAAILPGHINQLFRITEYASMKIADLISHVLSYTGDKEDCSLADALSTLNESYSESNLSSDIDGIFEALSFMNNFSRMPIAEKKARYYSFGRTKESWFEFGQNSKLQEYIKVIYSANMPYLPTKEYGIFLAFQTYLKFIVICLMSSGNMKYEIEEYDLLNLYLKQQLKTVLDAYVRQDRIIVALESLLTAANTDLKSSFKYEEGKPVLHLKAFQTIFSGVTDILTKSIEENYEWVTKGESFLRALPLYQTLYEVAMNNHADIEFIKNLTIPMSDGIFDSVQSLPSKGVAINKSNIGMVSLEDPCKILPTVTRIGSIYYVAWNEGSVAESIRQFHKIYDRCISIFSSFVDRYFEPFSANWRPPISIVYRESNKNVHIVQIGIVDQYDDNAAIVSAKRTLSVFEDKLRASHRDTAIEEQMSVSRTNFIRSIGTHEAGYYSARPIVIDNTNLLKMWFISTIQPKVKLADRKVWLDKLVGLDEVTKGTKPQEYYEVEYSTELYYITPSRSAKYSTYIGNAVEDRPGRPVLSRLDSVSVVANLITNPTFENFKKLWFSLPYKFIEEDRLDEIYVGLADKLLDLKQYSRPRLDVPEASSFSHTLIDSFTHSVIFTGSDPELYLKRQLIEFDGRASDIRSRAYCSVSEFGSIDTFVSANNILPYVVNTIARGESLVGSYVPSIFKKISGKESKKNDNSLAAYLVNWRSTKSLESEILINVPYRIVEFNNAPSVYVTHKRGGADIDNSYLIDMGWDSQGLNFKFGDRSFKMGILNNDYHMERFLDIYPKSMRAFDLALSYLNDVAYMTKFGVVDINSKYGSSTVGDKIINDFQTISNYFEPYTKSNYIGSTGEFNVALTWQDFVSRLKSFTKKDILTDKYIEDCASFTITPSDDVVDSDKDGVIGIKDGGKHPKNGRICNDVRDHLLIRTSNFINWFQSNITMNPSFSLTASVPYMYGDLERALKDKEFGISRPIVPRMSPLEPVLDFNRELYYDYTVVENQLKDYLLIKIQKELFSALLSLSGN